MTVTERDGNQAPWVRKLFWPLAFGEPPRRNDDTVDVLALCRRWDAAFNRGTSERPNPIRRAGEP